MTKKAHQSISRTLINTLLTLSLTLFASLGQAESALTATDLPPWFKPELQVHLVAMAKFRPENRISSRADRLLERPARDYSKRDSPRWRGHPETHQARNQSTIRQIR